jgi:hypothetical protein
MSVPCQILSNSDKNFGLTLVEFIELSGPLSASQQHSSPVNNRLYLQCYASYAPEISSMAQGVLLDVPC